ncbi:MAG: hypothetical protein RIR97_1889 [Pseudomonadota bacterium]
MTSTEPQKDRNSRDDIIAGEFVLGVLSTKDRAAVLARMKEDSGFAERISRWEQHFSQLNDAYEDVAPPAQLFANVEKRLFTETQKPKVSLWSSLVLWRSLAFASLVLVAALGLFEFGMISSQQPAKPLVAQLMSESGNLNLVALYDAQSGIVKLTPAAAGKPEEKSLELWLIDGDQPAVSLGILPASGNGEVKIPPALRSRITDGMVLAVSLEPFGGSPTGKATGPVIAVGKAESL